MQVGSSKPLGSSHSHVGALCVRAHVLRLTFSAGAECPGSCGPSKQQQSGQAARMGSQWTHTHPDIKYGRSGTELLPGREGMPHESIIIAASCGQPEHGASEQAG